MRPTEGLFGKQHTNYYEYDKLERLLKAILPDNSIRSIVCDDLGKNLYAPCYTVTVIA